MAERRAPTRPTLARLGRVLLAATVTPVAVLGLLATPAQARPVEAAAGSAVGRMVAAATYLVQRGDTLWGLAARWCGSGRSWPALAAANPQVSNPDRIYAGRTRLTVSCARPAAAAASRSTGTARTSGTGWVHPLASGVRAASAGACPGAPRSGHRHQGVDLNAPSGATIRAVTAGRVVVSRWSSSAGWFVAVDHGSVQSVYMHLRQRGASVGAQVGAGQSIGLVGATGNATGPHLHFEIHDGLWANRLSPGRVLRQHGVDIGC